MGKRGRKPGKTNPKQYFGDEEELAVVEYLNSTDDSVRERIFNTKLKKPLYKMTECIIRRYNLCVSDEPYEDTFNDALSFLLTKMYKFDPSKNYKAYSYFGTIIKNYLLGKKDKLKKEKIRNPSYDLVEEDINNSIKYTTDNNEHRNVAKEIIDHLVVKLKEMETFPENFSLKPNELKLCSALIVLFENWDYVLSTNGSNKLNKSAILLFLKESTGFEAKGIRENSKKFDNAFKIIKNFVIE